MPTTSAGKATETVPYHPDYPLVDPQHPNLDPPKQLWVTVHHHVREDAQTPARLRDRGPSRMTRGQEEGQGGFEDVLYRGDMGLDDFVKSRYTLWQCRLGTHTELSIVMTMNNEDEVLSVNTLIALEEGRRYKMYTILDKPLKIVLDDIFVSPRGQERLVPKDTRHDCVGEMQHHDHSILAGARVLGTPCLRPGQEVRAPTNAESSWQSAASSSEKLSSALFLCKIWHIVLHQYRQRRPLDEGVTLALCHKKRQLPDRLPDRVIDQVRRLTAAAPFAGLENEPPTGIPPIRYFAVADSALLRVTLRTLAACVAQKQLFSCPRYMAQIACLWGSIHQWLSYILPVHYSFQAEDVTGMHPDFAAVLGPAMRILGALAGSCIMSPRLAPTFFEETRSLVYVVCATFMDFAVILPSLARPPPSVCAILDYSLIAFSLLMDRVLRPCPTSMVQDQPENLVVQITHAFGCKRRLPYHLLQNYLSLSYMPSDLVAIQVCRALAPLAITPNLCLRRPPKRLVRSIIQSCFQAGDVQYPILGCLSSCYVRSSICTALYCTVKAGHLSKCVPTVSARITGPFTFANVHVERRYTALLNVNVGIGAKVTATSLQADTVELVG
ncbi:hypothetical protein FB107DRAFT_251156 [Schizophyllum commune]